MSDLAGTWHLYSYPVGKCVLSAPLTEILIVMDGQNLKTSFDRDQIGKDLVILEKSPHGYYLGKTKNGHYRIQLKESHGRRILLGYASGTAKPPAHPPRESFVGLEKKVNIPLQPLKEHSIPIDYLPLHDLHDKPHNSGRFNFDAGSQKGTLVDPTGKNRAMTVKITSHENSWKLTAVSEDKDKCQLNGWFLPLDEHQHLTFTGYFYNPNYIDPNGSATFGPPESTDCTRTGHSTSPQKS